MTAQMWLQFGLVLLIVFLLNVPVGRYLTDIVMDRRTRFHPVFDPVEESRQGRDRMVSSSVVRLLKRPPWLLLFLKIFRPRTRSHHSQTRRDAFRTRAHVGAAIAPLCHLSYLGKEFASRSDEIDRTLEVDVRSAGSIPDRGSRDLKSACRDRASSRGRALRCCARAPPPAGPGGNHAGLYRLLRRMDDLRDHRGRNPAAVRPVGYRVRAARRHPVPVGLADARRTWRVG